MLAKLVAKNQMQKGVVCKSWVRINSTRWAGLGSTRDFGIVQEYNERKNKKLINNLSVNEEPKFWVTASRPSNFGDHLDVKTKADNWFDENR